MTELRHIGIYVHDLIQEQQFFENVFLMKAIVSQEETHDTLITSILESADGCVRISKLLTERGQQTGHGDMIELIEVTAPKMTYSPRCISSPRSAIASVGTAHICLGIDDMDGILTRLCRHGGQILTAPVTFPNGKRCAFCADPEGNILELIQ